LGDAHDDRGPFAVRGLLDGVYMGLAALVEERDLVEHFGGEYEQYRRRVPMFVPRLAAIASVFQSQNAVGTAPESTDIEAFHG
jgi:hypothetical protein